ncbi:CU044_5270 family protein [Streptomyces sp. WI04-05B]|uniref:CU044_5270 family protein n=1 Tax=Streptomyces TaxID=1883 RepID=UPI0029B7062E|nr:MULTISPECIES: CU044_5270 family protein [unclassified Streptomyces]MDX2546112.1 CU044_5270 family protein [Streptomyces sp. WI04-05B]MDX2587198.1 CU044_5270 family protein [Streptomyces sp. WI04-05A]
MNRMKREQRVERLEGAEREALAELLPSPGEPVLSSDRNDLLRDHLMREFTQEIQEIRETRETGSAPAAAPGVHESAARPCSRPRRRFAMIAVPLATAVLVAGAVVVGAVVSSPPEPDRRAVDLLNRIATVAAAKTPVSVRDDQYVYVRFLGSLEITEVPDSGLQIFRRVDWTAVDGKRLGLARTTVLSGPNLPGVRTPKGVQEDMTLSADPNVTTYRELEALPTDPDALLKKIYADTGNSDSADRGQALELIGDMLDTATLLPEVNAALYRAAAKIPGVSVVENARDLSGRRGIGLRFKDRDDHETWVFDKESLAYLGSDESALLGTGIVDKVGDTPGG